MTATDLIAELGAKLGTSLNLSEAGTCRVFFDEDEVDFERAGESLYVMADVSSAAHREDAYGRLLKANRLGRETGGACIGLDGTRGMFTLHNVFRDNMPYATFEEELMLFIKALRYWKEWLALPPAQGESGVAAPSFGMEMLKA